MQALSEAFLQVDTDGDNGRLYTSFRHLPEDTYLNGLNWHTSLKRSAISPT